MNEHETLERLGEVIQSVISEEARLLKYWRDANPLVFEDKVLRAWGALQSARLMNGAEFLKYYSLCRTGWPPVCSRAAGHARRAVCADPARVHCGAAGRALEPAERDTIRANMCREALRGMKPNIE